MSTKGGFINFDKWLEYWKTSVEWDAAPSNEETWNGAVDSVCNYLRNSTPDGLEDVDDLIHKIQNRFKCEL